MCFLLLAILSLVLLPYILTKQNSRKTIRPPGPLGLPFIGNMHQFDKAKPHLYLWKLSQKYGPLVYLKYGSMPILVVSTAKMAKEFLQNQDFVYCSRPQVLGQQKLSYNGMDIAFSPYNEHWKEMRKICVHHLFSHKQVLSFRPIREDEVSHMVKRISKLAFSSELVNLSKIAMSLASNLICRVAFGRRYDGEEFEKKRFDRLVMEAQALMVGFYFSDYFPSLGWLDKFTKISDRLENNFKELDLFYQELIDEHLNPSRPKENDILDLLLKLKDQNSSSVNLTWDHIKALLMDLFVAGTDTVAAALVWTMTALMMRPCIMKEAQTEIRNVIGEKGTVSEEDIKKLPYLKAVIMETLRLYPPAPLIFRQDTTGGYFRTIDGYKIQPGTRIFINGWAISRDAETWQNPDTFAPERFINSNKVADFAMIPFGGGRRGCPGMSMGLIALELALANLLYTFDWEMPYGMKMEDIDTDAIPGLTMHKKNALLLLPKKYV
ncbi:cytochrome P450 83B1-like [Olea europaea var. sylvestris]|uniref:cytochrome P450 83B1-like n=1 Tax=Olea europaea var. sylvestris TaxID=158386 RepID=UPI000C1CEC0A|nr:cytochrome P450 83B1-like [Olea europaea var. sylvestris]